MSKYYSYIGFVNKLMDVNEMCKPFYRVLIQKDIKGRSAW